MEKHFSRFFWGSTTNKDKYHWRFWKNMYFPRNEGGLGMRNKKDICDILNIKKWWRFSDGVYSNNFAWNCIREARVSDHIWKNIWHKNMSFKMFGKESSLDSLCFATTMPKTIKHLFIDNEPAKHLGKFFDQPLGVVYRRKQVKVFLQEWWQTPGHNAIHIMMIKNIPILIF
ncbi:hypothetical protein H5410_003877 [Solanum commersonii]|uniref:Uncharacterized protein n=1 Tax=Solanum commersonii TaxID=4109 RepID=A0A9J6B682_SOLCO|nr:hypothetical protein H5410_003877 [Solanum commersonii]